MTEEQQPADQVPDTATADVDKKVERRFKLAGLIVPFITLVLGAAIGYGITVYNGRMRVLRYAVSSTSALFPKPEIEGRKLAITLDNKPIDNVSSVTVFIGNADQDYNDVPVHLRFAPVDGQPPKIIQVKPKLTPEEFEKFALADMGDGSVRMGYKIHVWNRGKVIQFDCLVEGPKAPDASVTTLAKGVETKQVSIQEKDKDNTTNIFIGIGIGVFVAMVIAVIRYQWAREALLAGVAGASASEVLTAAIAKVLAEVEKKDNRPR